MYEKVKRQCDWSCVILSEANQKALAGESANTGEKVLGFDPGEHGSVQLAQGFQNKFPNIVFNLCTVK